MSGVSTNMTDTNRIIKDMLRNCEKELMVNGDGVALTTEYVRRPNCPLINVFWDGVPSDGREEIRYTFESIWALALDADEQIGYTEGSMVSETLIRNMRDQIAQLLKSSMILNKSRICVAHYLNCMSPDYEAQIRCLCESARPDSGLKKGIVGEIYHLLLVICDNDDIGDTDTIRGNILQTETQIQVLPNVRGIYLSNRLADGNLLTNAQQFENYRVAADIALLTTTEPDHKNQEPKDLIAWFLQPKNNYSAYTAAYTQIHKPGSDVVKIMLNKVLQIRMQAAEDNRKQLVIQHAHESQQQFWLAAGLEDTSLRCVEDAFARYIQHKLPKENALQNLPNWEKASKNDNYQEACRETSGFFELFVQRYFSDIGTDISQEDLTSVGAALIKDLRLRFDYRFSKDYFRLCADHLDYIQPKKSSTIYGGAVYRAKCAFYTTVKPYLKQAILQYADCAGVFEEHLKLLCHKLILQPMPTQAGMRPVDEYYKSQAETLLSGSGTGLLDELNPTESLSELCSTLSALFAGLTAKNPTLFHASLEEELNARMIASTGAPMISTKLDDNKIESQQRMPVTDYLTGDNKSFYLFYGDAVFSKALKLQSGRFTTNCTDIAERLILYPFDPQSIIA